MLPTWLDISCLHQQVYSISIPDNTSTPNITESFEEKTIEENLLHEVSATNTFECEKYNLDCILLATRDLSLTLLMKPAGLISTVGEYL